jgi:hypothetical protein
VAGAAHQHFHSLLKRERTDCFPNSLRHIEGEQLASVQYGHASGYLLDLG